MSLEEVRTIGELMGVLAVIVTLLFVIKKIRQNIDQLRIGASNEWLNLQFQLCSGIVENREVAELCVKGEKDDEFGSLDRVDQQRLIMFEHRAISGWSNLFQMRQRKLLPDAQWHELNGLMETMGDRYAVRQS
jgi:hypothetical protein